MRLPTLLLTLLAGAATAALASDDTTTRTAAIYIQPLTGSSSTPSTPPALLAELAIPDNSPEDNSDIVPAEVLSYSAPDLSDDEADDNATTNPDQNKLVRIGIYSPSTRTWLSSTTVTSTSNFAKGYAPHFVLTLDGEGEGNNVLGVACRGVAIDAGVTRDFGPQAVVVRTGLGSQPALGRPVVLSPEGRKVGEEVEKSFVQKWVFLFPPLRFLLIPWVVVLGVGVRVAVLTLLLVGTGGCWLLGWCCPLREGAERSNRFGQGLVFGILFPCFVNMCMMVSFKAMFAPSILFFFLSGHLLFSPWGTCSRFLSIFPGVCPCRCPPCQLPSLPWPALASAQAQHSTALGSSQLAPLSAGCQW
jgi:hypothetical protein